jgi:sterol desaturase/sphingolipid hydroxylase (fatty acid hydroxylase superfamily)
MVRRTKAMSAIVNSNRMEPGKAVPDLIAGHGLAKGLGSIEDALVTILQSLILTALVYIAEHLLLTRRYGMPSSLQRLFGFGWAARTDLAFTLLYNPVFWWLPRLPLLLCGQGILYVLVGRGLRELDWPGALAFVADIDPLTAFFLMLLCADLVRYWMHRLFHAVPVLWALHRLHHAAPEMNIANGTRVALGEHFLNELAILLAFFAVFGPNLPGVALLVIVARNGIDLIQHSDLPWGYGLLGRVFASPRFHRMHHSVDPQDYDSNYADIFAVWDHLFGTVARRYRAEPATGSHCRVGLPDQDEMEELNRGMRSLLHGTFPLQALALWQRSRRLRQDRFSSPGGFSGRHAETAPEIREPGIPLTKD